MENKKLRNESHAAYAAFNVYRSLGPSRTISEAFRSHRRMKGKSDNVRPHRNWYQWFDQHSWDARARDYDQQQADIAVADAREALIGGQDMSLKIANAMTQHLGRTIASWGTEAQTPKDILTMSRAMSEITAEKERLLRLAVETAEMGAGTKEVHVHWHVNRRDAPYDRRNVTEHHWADGTVTETENED